MTTNFPALLEKHGHEIARALPKHLSAERMMRVALTAFRLNPRLAQCEPLSVYASVIQASQLGLEIGGPMAEAHLVPFKNECQLIPGYQGLMKLARNTGQVADIYAYEVRERDKFNIELGLRRSLAHQPLMSPSGFMASDDERGQVTGFYAVAVFKDGTTAFTAMAKPDVDTVRNASAGYKSKRDSPWITNYVAMGCKTVIRRLCKFLPKSPELATALVLDARAEQGLQQKITIDAAASGEYAEEEYENTPLLESAPADLSAEGINLMARIDTATSMEALEALRPDVAGWVGPGRDRLKGAWKAQKSALRAAATTAAVAEDDPADVLVGADYVSAPSADAPN